MKEISSFWMTNYKKFQIYPNFTFHLVKQPCPESHKKFLEKEQNTTKAASPLSNKYPIPESKISLHQQEIKKI